MRRRLGIVGDAANGRHSKASKGVKDEALAHSGRKVKEEEDYL